MRSAPLLPTLLLAALLLAALLPSQSRIVFGVVQDADGEVAAGATVTCAGTPWFAKDDGTTRVVEVATDARGRWQAKLDRARTWSVWAVRPEGDGGGFAISPVREGVRPGLQAPLILTAERSRQRLELTGADAWPELEGLHVGEVTIGRHVLPVTLDDPDRLPPLPPVDAATILDGAGAPLAIVDIERTKTDDLLRAPLPPPRELGVRTLLAKDKVASGCDVYLDLGTGIDLESWLRLPGRARVRRLGTTDDQGQLTVRVPARVHEHVLQHDIKLQARRNGWRWTTGGIRAGGQTFSGNATTIPAADHYLEITMLEGGPLTTKPAGAGQASYIAAVPGTAGVARWTDLTLDDDGKARLPFRGWTQGPTNMFLRTTTSDGVPRWSAIVRPGLIADLEDRRLQLQVLSAERGPPDGARAALCAWDSSVQLPLPLDAAGRAEVALGPGDWMVFVSDGRSAAWRSLRATDGVAGAVDWTLALEPMAIAAVDVLDPEGDPAAFGRLEYGIHSTGTVSEDRGEPHERLLLQQFAIRLLHHRRRLDQNGHTDFPILLPELHWQLQGARCRNLEPPGAEPAVAAGGAGGAALGLLRALDPLTLAPGEEHELSLRERQ